MNPALITEPAVAIAQGRSKAHTVVLGLLVVQCLVVGAVTWVDSGLEKRHWLDGLLLLFATLATLSSLCRQLPAQNVVLASVLIVVIAWMFGQLPGLWSGTDHMAARDSASLVHPLSWAFPLVWLVFILNARGVARLILQSWRDHPWYGLWVLGLTAFLVLVMDMSFEPFATLVRQYWHWPRTDAQYVWYSTPWKHFVMLFVATLIILLLTTTTLINKAPVTPGLGFSPLVIWLLLSFLFATGAAAHRLWGAAVFAAVQAILFGSFAINASEFDAQIRRPKSEGRKKVETRNPKSSQPRSHS